MRRSGERLVEDGESLHPRQPETADVAALGVPGGEIPEGADVGKSIGMNGADGRRLRAVGMRARVVAETRLAALQHRPPQRQQPLRLLGRRVDIALDESD